MFDMKKSKSQAVKDWRYNTKIRIVEAMGGCCQICKYNKCNNALELHHIDPTQKELSFGKVRANPKSWNKIVLELKKSILLCSNCHKEVHAGITNLPETYAVFDDKFSDYKNSITDDRVCQAQNCDNHLSYGQKKFCSNTCMSKNMPSRIRTNTKKIVDWSDLEDLKYIKKLSNVEISKIKGCSETAVRKQLKKGFI